MKEKSRAKARRGRKHEDFSPGWRKYDSYKPEIRLTPEDEQALAVLVERYGKDFITDAVPKVHRRKAGRPSNPYLILEKISYAEWIEERAAEYRKEGCRAPIRKARIEAYHMEYDGDEDPNSAQLGTIKKRHLQGRKYLRAGQSASKNRASKGRK